MNNPINLQILARLVAQPWAIKPGWLDAAAQMIMSGQPRGECQSAEARPAKPRLGYVPLNWESAMAIQTDAMPPIPLKGVTVILAWGILGRGWTAIDKWWLDAIEVDDLARAVASAPRGDRVIIWFRSPGGIVTGIPETADALRAAARDRGVDAFTDDLCASAAYWLASQCGTVAATPTAEVGSIGVYIAFYDYCEMLAQRGVKLELFRAGDEKGLGLVGKPLSEKDRARLQGSVDESYAAFTSAVTDMRAVPKEAMQGQTLSGDAAAAAALVDGFFPSADAFFASIKTF